MSGQRGGIAPCPPKYATTHVDSQFSAIQVGRHTSQHQLRRGVAPRATGDVPVSPPDRMDFHQRDSARRSAPEMVVSSGHSGSKSSVGEKVSSTERPCDSSRRSVWSRRSTDLSAFHCVLVARMNRLCLLRIIHCICAMCFYSN